MAVEIPRIQRTQAPAPGKTPGMDDRFRGDVENTARVGNAVEGLGQAAFAQATKYESEAINNEAIKRVNEYDDWFKKRLYGDSEAGTPGLRNLDGDPTEAYNQFDMDDESKYTELMSPDGLSSKAAAHVEKELLQRRRTLHGTRLMEFGNQNAKYTDQLYKTRLDIAYQDATAGMMTYDPKNPASIEKFMGGITDIQRLEVDRAKTMGGAVETGNPGDVPFLDENNNVRHYKINDITKNEIKKGISKATHDSVMTLLNSDRADGFEAAKTLMKDYPHYIDEVNKGKLTEEIEKRGVDELAFDGYAKVSHLPISQRASEIDKTMPATNAQEMKIKHRTKQIANQERQYYEQNRKLREDQHYQIGMKALIAQMNSKTVPETGFDIETMYVGKLPMTTFLNNMSAEQQAAMYSMVKRPKESNPVKLAEAYRKMQNNEYLGMSPEDQALTISGLSPKHAGEITSYWKKVNNPKTPAQRVALMKTVGQQAENAFKAAGFFKPGNQYTKNHLEDFALRMQTAGDNLNDNASIQDINDMIQMNIIEERKKLGDEPFKKWAPGDRPPIIPPSGPMGQRRSMMGNAPATTPAPKKQMDTIPEDQRLKAFNDFKAEKGHPPAKPDDLVKWYTEKQSK